MDLRPHKFPDEEAHDRFALATIIFMLLNRGLHPYQGIMSFDEPGTETVAGKIKNNLYPYRAGNGRITPHQDSLYPFLPDGTNGLFDRAFSLPNNRPSAAEWLDHLNRLALQSESCERTRVTSNTHRRVALYASATNPQLRLLDGQAFRDRQSNPPRAQLVLLLGLGLLRVGGILAFQLVQVVRHHLGPKHRRVREGNSRRAK
jgi:hypothetical protein